VVQRQGIDTIPELADFLLGCSNPPAWWQFMPIRDYPDLTPSSQQSSQLRSFMPRLRSMAASLGVTLIADDAARPDGTPAVCTVPEFTAYAAADTGLMFGCNMLCYRDGAIGSITGDSAARSWTGPSAEGLRARCRKGGNDACAGCDPASRAMNHHLRDLATAFRLSRTSDLHGVQS
ncbi:MAG: hypothetical protein LH616_13890, partial [Ilumatobacteraceae bacterium]|nr:hypothetical protein [Ilumatobacteraceae bacterium]